MGRAPTTNRLVFDSDRDQDPEIFLLPSAADKSFAQLFCTLIPIIKYVKIRYNSLKNSLSDVIAHVRACCSVYQWSYVTSHSMQ